MTKYELIADELQSRVDSGELTLEDANRLNDLAYEKYVLESSDDNSKDLELIDELRGLVEEGKVKLGKDCTKCIKELIKNAEEESDDDDEKDDKEDSEQEESDDSEE